MSYTQIAPAPIRVFLFKRNLVDALHVCLAIEMSPLWCDVQMLEDRAATVQSICAAIRAGGGVPGLVLFDGDPREAESLEALSEIRKSPELRFVPMLVIGDGEDPEVEALAQRHGADGFLPRPTISGELARTGSEIAYFWSKRQAKPA